MKRFLLAIVAFLILSASANAAHIKGGFFTYRYLGPGAGTNVRYNITLTVYMICSAQGNPGQLNNPINFSIFDGGSNQFLQNVSVPITNQYQLNKLYDEPCITGDQSGCYYYIVVYDLPSVELSAAPEGYTIAYQRCCRIAGINNVVNSGAVGNTFTIKIPGTNAPLNAYTNSSPQFLVNDTAVVCAGSYFQYSVQASDIDGDSLSYQFCDAYTGADQANPAPGTALNPPYSPIPYQAPYSGTQPMGPGVFINATTGLISGIAPAAPGEYVICVCVNEFRNGVLIASTRKELHIRAGDCDPLDAVLNPKPTTCDGFTVNFKNDNPNDPPGTEYFWTFGEPSTGNLDTSILATPSHTYTTAGTFTVRLRVSLAGGLCADTTSFQVNVFPGFFPGFTATGGCITFPFQFTDTTRTNYGVVDTWSWNFGDLTTLADTSHLQNPQWTYSTPGPKDVTLTVTNSKGCINTAQFTVDVLDKPIITLAFNDTLICRNDAVQLNASGTGVFNWTPPVNIINANTATPTVNPVSNQWYYVNLNDNGCLNNDSVLVRVVNSVTLKAINDTTICQGDAIQLGATSDGLTFSWTPVANLNNPNIINPIATTNTTTTYNVVASIGSCSATDQVVVTTVPYPVATVGPDQLICYNTSAQLNASHNGISFSWSPTTYLNNPNILNPVATPPRTTAYILTVFDNKGCPKPGRDTIVVTVNPKVRAYAGRDTIVVVNQPLQLIGTGGVNYLWSPPTGLTNPAIYNPIGVYGMNIDSVRYKLLVSDAAGCADSAYVTVRVYKVNPTIFVPTAFTPNGDGLNDTVYPISVGIKKINYFSIYNRWGELVFTTTQDRKGWDGTIAGKLQGTAVFVWMVSAIDYLGAPIFLKGTVTLIR
jgi:gliding motility-associated-like protein